MSIKNDEELKRKLTAEIIAKEYSSFGQLMLVELKTLEIYAIGHPICDPPEATCNAGTTTDSSGYECQGPDANIDSDNYLTYTYCIS